MNLTVWQRLQHRWVFRHIPKDKRQWLALPTLTASDAERGREIWAKHGEEGGK